MTRMSRAGCVVAGILVCVAAGGGAVAQVTTGIELTGVSGGVMGGVYTSPYIATIGTTAGVNVICDDFADDSYIGESWTAYVTPLSALTSSSPVKWTGAAGLTQSQAYATEAYLAEELLSVNQSTQWGQTKAGEYSFAMWGLFDPSALDSISGSEQTAAMNYLRDAENYITSNGLTAANFSNATLYTWDPSGGLPTGGCGTPTCTPPQEFIAVKMAEPPAWGSLGIDLFAVAGTIFAFRRRIVRTVD